MHAKPTYAILAGMMVLGAMGSVVPPKLQPQPRSDGVTITFLTEPEGWDSDDPSPSIRRHAGEWPHC